MLALHSKNSDFCFALDYVCILYYSKSCGDLGLDSLPVYNHNDEGVDGGTTAELRESMRMMISGILCHVPSLTVRVMLSATAGSVNQNSVSNIKL